MDESFAFPAYEKMDLDVGVSIVASPVTDAFDIAISYLLGITGLKLV